MKRTIWRFFQCIDGFCMNFTSCFINEYSGSCFFWTLGKRWRYDRNAVGLQSINILYVQNKIPSPYINDHAPNLRSSKRGVSTSGKFSGVNCSIRATIACACRKAILISPPHSPVGLRWTPLDSTGLDYINSPKSLSTQSGGVHRTGEHEFT